MFALGVPVPGTTNAMGAVAARLTAVTIAVMTPRKAELSNPTLGFYDRMGGERLLDDRGQFGGAFGWRDVGRLIK